LAASPKSEDEAKLWVFAFLILLAVSSLILAMRVMKSAFLALDFEVMIVYLPTALAGAIALYLFLRTKPKQ
jgi:TRAP-type C4-dicarboxylate transport system permease small subunit